MTLMLERSCCGCSVRTGTIIIAIYILTCSIILTVFGSVFLGVLLLKPNEEFYSDFVGTKEQIKQDMIVTLVSVIVGGFIQVILNITLLVGVRKESPRLVLVWLVSYVVLLVISMLVLMSSFFQVPTRPRYQVATVINIALSTYFLLVVKSFYHSIKSTTLSNINVAYDVEDNSMKKNRPFE